MNRAYSLDWSPNALSPITAKKALEKNLKKVEQLKEQLQIEINEKNELAEENSKLQLSVDNLNKKIKSKIDENQALKDNIEDLHSKLEATQETSKRCNNTSELNLLKSELEDLKKYNTHLEQENEDLRISREKYEINVKSVMSDLFSLEQQYEEVKFRCQEKEIAVRELQKCCESYRTEITDLRECNQVLREEMSQLELHARSRKSVDFQNSECLERELEFQYNKERLEEMTLNLQTVETEQAKLVAINHELARDKEYLNEMLESLNLKIEKSDKIIEDLKQKLNTVIMEHDEVKKKFLAEKREDETSFAALTEKFHLVSQQLEYTVEENEKREVRIRDIQMNLQKKTDEFDSLTSQYKELMQRHDNCMRLLGESENKLEVLSVENNELQAKVNFMNDQIEKLNKNCNFLTQSNDNYAESLNNANHKILILSDEKSEIIARLEELKVLHHKSQDENYSLSIRGDDLIKENEKYASVTDTLKMQLQSKSNELQLKADEMATLTQEYNTLSRDFNELSENCEKLAESLANVKTEVLELRDVNCNQDVQLKNCTLQNEKLQSEYLLLTKEYEKLLQSEKDAKAQITELNQDRSDLSTKFNQLEINYNELLMKYNVLTVQNENHKELVNAVNNEKNEIQGNLEQLQISFNNLTLEHNSLANKYKEVEVKRYELFDQLEHQKFLLENKMKEFEELKTNHFNLLSNHKELQKNYDDHLIFVKEIENRLLQVDKSYEKLKEDLKEQVHVNENLKHENSMMTEQIEELLKTRNIILEEKCVIQEQLIALTHSFEKLEKECNQLKCQKTELISENDKLATLVTGLESKLNERALQYEKVVSEKCKLAEENKINLTELKCIQNQLMTVTEVNKDTEKNLLLTNETLEKLNKEFNVLKNEYEELEKSMNYVKSEALQLETQKNNCENKIRLLEANNDSLQQKYNSAFEELKVQAKNIEEFKEQVLEKQQVEKKLEHMQLNYKELQCSYDKVESEYNCLRSSYEDASKNNITLTEKLKDSEDRFSQLRLNYNELQCSYDKVESEYNCLRSSYEDASKNNITLTEKLKDSEDRFSQLRTEKQVIESKLGEEKTQLENLVSDLEKKNVQLSSSCATLQKSNQDLEKETEKLLQTLHSLQHKLDIVQKTNIEFDDENKKLRTEISNSAENLQTLMTEQSELKTKYQKLADNLKSAEGNIHALKLENADLNLHIACISSEKEKMQKHGDKLFNQNQSLNEMVQSLTQLNSDLCAQNEKLGQRVIEIENSLQQLNLDKKNILADVELKNSEIRDKSVIIESLTLRVQSLENNLEIMTKENDKITDKIATIQNEQSEQIKDLHEEYNNIVNNIENKMRDACFERDTLSERLRQTETELNDLHRELHSVSEERANLLENVAKLETLNSKFQEQNESLKIHCLKIEEDKSNSMNELREMLLYEIEQLQRSNEKLKFEKEKLADNNKEKLARLKEIEKRVLMLEQSDNELREENTKLKKQVDECYESESNYRNENAILEQTIQELENENKLLLGQLKKLQNEVELLTSKIHHCKETEKKAEEMQKAMVVNEEILQEELTKVRNENDQLQAEVQQLVDKERMLSTQLYDKTIELDNLRSCFADKEEMICKLKEKEIDLQDESKQVADSLLKLQFDYKQAQDCIEDLMKQKKIEKVNRDALLKQTETISSENEDLRVKLNEMHDTVKYLESNKKTLEQIISQTEDKINSLTREHAEEIEKYVLLVKKEEKHSALISAQINELTKEKQLFEKEREELLKQIECLNFKLVEENQRINLLQRTHSSQIQKQIEISKSFELKLQHYEEVEKEAFCRRINELKLKLDEALETNEEERMRINDYEMLVKENENLLLKIDHLETVKRKLEKINNNILQEKDEHQKVEEELCTEVRNLNEMLKNQKDENLRLTEEYNIYKAEYRKIVEHKDEIVHEYREAMAEENKKLMQKCEELEKLDHQKEQILNEKENIIKMLTTKIEELEIKSEPTDESRINLNQTHVVASGPDSEAYAILCQENLKLLKEKESSQKKILDLELELEKEKEQFRNKAQKLYEKISNKIIAEYEGKLQRAKTEYQKIVVQKYEAREKEWKKKEEEYKMMLNKEKEHIKDLSSQVWDISDRYLQLKQTRETRFSEDNLCSPSSLLRRTRSATHLNVDGRQIPDGERRLSTISTVSENSHMPSRRRPAMTISAKVFPSEDEEQEIFDNACLADLKQGRMPLEDSNDYCQQRLSILQARNSLCPPHLKSSYPAETQFLPLQEFKENDIKMGLSSETDTSDIENLLPGDRQRRTRNQCGNETPRNVLKESNDNGTSRRKSFTPKFFNLFALRGHATVTIPSTTQHQDENLSVTPRRNRLSSIRRRFSRNPQEFGSTNSGFC